MTDDRLVLVHTVPFTDPDQLRKACTAVAWVRKVVDSLVIASLVELGADRKNR